ALARKLEAQGAVFTATNRGRNGRRRSRARRGDCLRAGQRLELGFDPVELESAQRAASNGELDRVLHDGPAIWRNFDDGAVPVHLGLRPGGAGRRRPAQQRKRSEQANPEADHVRLLRTRPHPGGQVPGSGSLHHRGGSGFPAPSESSTTSAPASLNVPESTRVRPTSRTLSPASSARRVETSGVRPPCGSFAMSAGSSAGVAFPANGIQRNSSGSVQNDPDHVRVVRRGASSGTWASVFGAAPRASTTVSSATRSSAATATTV